jgi:CheY-like chemotaxis protein
MNILIAEDDIISRCVLEDLLTSWGHMVHAVSDGQQALDVLTSPHRPTLAILDWKTPHLEGVDVCRQLRQSELSPAPYLIILTVQGDTDNIVAGLQAGANDYITKPFAPEELRARVNVGVQMVELQQRLANRVKQLEEALSQVRQLQGMLPICCYCKKIRDDKNYWQQVETYFARHSDVLFSHGICPDCLDEALQTVREEIGVRGQKSEVRGQGSEVRSERLFSDL